MYSQHVTMSTFSLIFHFFTATYLSKARYSLFVLKVPLNPKQSIYIKVTCTINYCEQIRRLD